MTPKNNHKIFIPQKIFVFLSPPPPPPQKKKKKKKKKNKKNIEIQNFEPLKRTRAYVCMKISEYTPPPLVPIHATIIIHRLKHDTMKKRRDTDKQRRTQIEEKILLEKNNQLPIPQRGY